MVPVLRSASLEVDSILIVLPFMRALEFGDEAERFDDVAIVPITPRLSTKSVIWADMSEIGSRIGAAAGDLGTAISLKRKQLNSFARIVLAANCERELFYDRQRPHQLH